MPVLWPKIHILPPQNATAKNSTNKQNAISFPNKDLKTTCQNCVNGHNAGMSAYLGGEQTSSMGLFGVEELIVVGIFVIAYGQI